MLHSRIINQMILLGTVILLAAVIPLSVILDDLREDGLGLFVIHNVEKQSYGYQGASILGVQLGIMSI